MILAVAGMAAAIVFGHHQLQRWKLDGAKQEAVLIGGSAVIFLLGGYLMMCYAYHLLKMVRYWILMYGLLLLAIIDMERMIIPNKALLVMVGIRAVLLVAECLCFPQLCLEILILAILGMAGGGLLFLAAGAITRKGLGMGDVKMIGVMGFYLGFRVLMSDLIITMTLTLVAGVTILLLKKLSLRSELPFAPLAAVGTVITILMGF